MISKTTSGGSATFPLPDSSPQSRETRTQLGRFLVIGTMSVLVDLGVYRLLVAQFGAPVDFAKAISYWFGVIVGFAGNKFWTFRSAQRSVREPIGYAVLYCATMFANIGCNRAVLSVVSPQATVLAFLFATGVTTCLNFVGMRFLVFRRGIQSRRAEDAAQVQHVSRKAA